MIHYLTCAICVLKACHVGFVLYVNALTYQRSSALTFCLLSADVHQQWSAALPAIVLRGSQLQCDAMHCYSHMHALKTCGLLPRMQQNYTSLVLLAALSS